METTEQGATDEGWEEYETHPLIVRMQEFLDYTNHVAEYSSLALNFEGLDDEMIDAVVSVLEFANEMMLIYETSLQEESVEELLQRESDIFLETENLAYTLSLCESGLDRYLILSKAEPVIISKFLADGFPLFVAANC